LPIDGVNQLPQTTMIAAIEGKCQARQIGDMRLVSLGWQRPHLVEFSVRC
jgi:hypothetical protein